MTLQDLPALNATLNGICACFLIAGYIQIKKKNEAAHRKFMIAAFCTSTLFLISYLTYHFLATETKFQGTGWIRPVYFFILITHIILAALIVPMVLATVWLGLKDKREKHRKLARWTFPLWMYVSVTGVVIYLMLYQLFPAAK